jgi:deoxyribose-phosphate aldolase
MTLTMSAIPTDVASSDSALRRFLHGLPGVDQVGADARAAALGTRSIKTDAKRWAIDAAISMIDLTTLEGQDTHGKVRALCAKGVHPDPSDPTCPKVAAICVYPDRVSVAKEHLSGSGVKVASVATSFPSGRAALPVKLADVRDAVASGADEVDMVIDRGAFLEGRYLDVYDEIVQVKAACADQHLKVILETGELVTYDTCAGLRGWPCWRAATSSRRPPARCRRPRRSRSPWSCSKRFVTSATRPGARWA